MNFKQLDLLKNSLIDWNVNYSVYPYNGYTVNEVLCQFFDAINKGIITINNYTEMVSKLIEWVQDEGLSEEVKSAIDEILKNGKLGELINKELLGDINEKLTNNTENITDLNDNVTKIGNKVNNITIVNVRDFGAKGDGKTDDTMAVEKAMKSLGGGWTPQSVILYFPTGNYKLTKSIIIDRGIITILGDGMDSTILSPTGKFDCISTKGSKNNFLYSVRIEGLTIYGGELHGKAINWKYAGLHCGLKNISIDGVIGVGLYIQSSFDHKIENIEIRGCVREGLVIDEIPYPNFEEISYITFNNVVVVDCNGGGVQYRINGGNNLYFNECKANEGEVGMLFNNGWCNRVRNFYMDGLHNKETTVFVVDGKDISDLSIENVYCWNAIDVINIKKCKSINLKNIDRNPYNAEGRDRYTIKIDNTFTGKCYVDNKLYNVLNESETPIKYELGTNVVGGQLEMVVIEKDFMSGYNSLDLEYQSSKNIVGVVACLKGDNQVSTSGGKVLPIIDTDWTGGYFRVKLSLPEGVTANATRKVKVIASMLYN